MTIHAKELRSLISAEGAVRLTIDDVPLAAPGPDEVIVRVDAAPINPSDLATLLGPSDPQSFRKGEGADRATYAQVPPQSLGRIALRAGKSLGSGNEGAGVVIAAGANAQHLLGKVVASMSGNMFASHRLLPANEVLEFPEGVSPEQAAAAFINPLTALGMVSTMRLEGHAALVHTAAASNLGQMLVRLCQADGVELVNIVRSAEQAAVLRKLGARYVLNSGDESFVEQLVAAIAATGATLAFDAVGGGKLGSQILGAMEAALVAKTPPVGPYGSPVHKQLYIYGRLDLSPTVLAPTVGMAWGTGGWLLYQHLQRVGPSGVAALQKRVTGEITGIFASQYARAISLDEAIDPAVIPGYQRRATGEKYLLRPNQ
ncbi:zinc-binding dehydrogenase [Devosia sp.]|uniref:zinc-binding dehydrogenase n=1 Tax=Devosia sp. TaxID=1871048 RepID=UPI001AD13E71|nr:zinc-binding dehydrogenase [Devosia sp.]MBN9336035.1 zinc-binding dehydrogenase [Devosia sp.]